MASRAFIEEEFDDDTDLPLPQHHVLPNTGLRGPLLQEITDDDDEEEGAMDDADEDEDGEEYDPREQVVASGSGSGSGSRSAGGMTVAAEQQRPTGPVMNRETTKRWTTLYPIYIDAKRPLHKNERRVARAASVWWPLSADMAEACARMGFSTLHDQGKRHPKDWENPGRVKLLFKQDGRPTNPYIKTKKQLLTRIGAYIQQKSPAYTPTPDTSQPHKTAQGRTVVPPPPEPVPPVTQRLPGNSPVIETGMLVESVKSSLAAEKGQGQQGQQGQVEGAQGKGKRKVIRVRA